MIKFKDLSNQRFGKLVALTPDGKDKDRCIVWMCQCDCGSQYRVAGKRLTEGHTKSCGCSRKIELTGQRFGRLVVSGRFGKVCDSIRWKCRCDCGKEHFATTRNLRQGNVQSCGCGHLDAVRKHNKSKAVWNTPEYKAYHGAKRRCTNPKDKDYADYGGRGIKFVFASFQEFYDEVGPRPSKFYTNDRIDFDGNYEKGNVRWATYQEQANNRRTSCLALNRRIVALEAENRSLLDELATLRVSKTSAVYC